jgi:hypothetical protein
MTVRATESGIITSYNFYRNEKYENTPSVNKPETKDFLEKAKEFSAKINPSIKDTVEVSVRGGYESLYDIYKTRIDKVMRDFEDILQTLPE